MPVARARRCCLVTERCRALLRWIAAGYMLCASLAVQAQEQVTIITFEYPPLSRADGQGQATRLVEEAFATQGVSASIEYLPAARAILESTQRRLLLLGALYPTDDVHRLHIAPLLRVELRVLMLAQHMPERLPAQPAAQQRALAGKSIGLLPVFDTLTLFRDYGLQPIRTIGKENATRMFASERYALMPCLLEVDCPQLQASLAAQGKPAGLWPHPLIPPVDIGLVYDRRDAKLEALALRFQTGLQQLRRSGRFKDILQAAPD